MHFGKSRKYNRISPSYLCEQIFSTSLREIIITVMSRSIIRIERAFMKPDDKSNLLQAAVLPGLLTV